MRLSDKMAIPVAVIVTVSSSASLVGSGCILYMARRRLDQILQRLLFALSLSDFFLSLTMIFMPLFVPAGLEQRGTKGNFNSCTAGGFFLMLFIAIGTSYNCAISVYYLASIRYNWKEKRSSNATSSRSNLQSSCWEVLLHLLFVLIPASVMTAAAATNSINPHKDVARGACWIGTYPAECEKGSHMDSKCERSSNATIQTLEGIFFIWGGLMTIVGLLSSFTVYVTVRNKLKKTLRFSVWRDNGTESKISTINDASNCPESPPTGQGQQTVERNQFERRILQVRTQCTLYSLAYLNTYIWPSLAVGLSVTTSTNQSSPGRYLLQIVMSLFFPSQGFLNFFVYIRPKVKRWRTMEPHVPLIWIYLKLVFDMDIPQGLATANDASAPSSITTNHGNRSSFFRAAASKSIDSTRPPEEI